ncbi:MAG: peptidyl-prolyl cis-trans isomerase [Prolixibacteraceae bacterium]|nr:peptidyl-prolyl cis-trans isomerase [Prolixibacteraceae bacterium]
MRRIIFSTLFLAILTISVFAQKEEILITIGNTEISKAEFERIYQKNNSNLYIDTDKKSPEEYLELFIDFKLKVIEAQHLKMDTSSAFINELNGYRKELAAPYLTDVKYDEKLVHEIYERMNTAINASHILLTLDANATLEEEEKVLERLKKIRQEILDGKNFEDAAFEYSEDPSAKENRGYIGYFTAFQMVTPFENGVFNTPAGQISEPIRSQYGYHLVKVADVTVNKGEIQVAHIMKAFPQNMTPEIKQQIKAEIDSLYNELQNGADFTELAKENSDDDQSASQGGIQQWFTIGRMIPEFAIPAFALENDGDYTKPVETPYGYHIIKRLALRPIPPFEELKAEIESRIKRDPLRTENSKKVFVEKLKNEYGFSENMEGIEKIKTLTIGAANSANNFPLFTIDGIEFGLDEFNAYLKEKKITSGNYYPNYEKWVENEITLLEDSRLEEKYPDFRYMVQEYHDGILLFNISEEKIWNYASQDSIGLMEFYEKNKNNHLWGERFKGLIVSCKNLETREKADLYFSENLLPTEIADMINQDENLISITEGAWEKGSNPVVDYYIWNQPEPENFNSELTFVRGDIIKPEPKTLEEARGLFISDYQKHLEEKWIQELRKKYKVKVNKKLLKTIDDA